MENMKKMETTMRQMHGYNKSLFFHLLEDDVIPRNQHHRVPTNQKNHFDQIDKVRSAIILDLHKDGTF